MGILSCIRIWLYKIIVKLYPSILKSFYKMDIGEGTRISRRAILDRAINPRGVHIGKYTDITGYVDILTHDACRDLKADTYIGNYCFIGTYSIILPGIHIGNEVIVGAGSVVTKDIPSNCIVAGNPAKIIRTGISCEKWGRLVNTGK